jgi:glycosyltransferase involved in cell wall biosynthesis
MKATLSERQVTLLTDVNQGGAAVAARRLALGLRQTGWDARQWHFSPAGQDAECQCSLDSREKRPPLERLLRNFSRPLAARLRQKRHERAFFSQLERDQPGLLNLHNLHACGVDHATLLKMPRNIKLVWTLHDCRAFEEFAFRWQESDGKTAIQAPEPADAKAARERFFEMRPDVVLVSPSRWLAGEARKRVPAAVRIEVIPYGLPTDIFRPQPRAEATRLHGLTGEKVRLGFSAATFDSRKGGDVFLQALRKMDCNTLEVLVWGNDGGTSWPDDLPLKRMGLVQDEKQLAVLYAACDLFVCPSRIDNFPNTILESLACGVPVVGSAVGGIPELVRPGETGWLYQGNTAENCARALADAMLEKSSWAAYGQRCRTVAETEFSLEKQARSYGALFDQLLNPS